MHKPESVASWSGGKESYLATRRVAGPLARESAGSASDQTLDRDEGNSMKICSLLPSGTEILFALGLGNSVVGVTDNCDYPAEARTKPVVVRSILPSHLPEREIDRQVKVSSRAGQSLYQLDREKLKQMRPDLIVTQELCHICATSPDDLGPVLAGLSSKPGVLTLSPRTISEIWDNILEVGHATGRFLEARALVSRLTAQIAKTIARDATFPARVLCLEWLDPPFVAGHWVPEMVALAGGIDVLGEEGKPGYEVDWQILVDIDPDVILAMPCGYHLPEVERELREALFPAEWNSLRAVRTRNVFAMDARSYFSRPGPRIADGIVELRELFDRVKRTGSRKRMDRVLPVAPRGAI